MATQPHPRRGEFPPRPRTLPHGAMRYERAHRQQTALRVSPASREHTAIGGLRSDDLERAPILVCDRVWIDHIARQDMAWNQRILSSAPRPRSRRHAEQTHPKARRRSQMARGTLASVSQGRTRRRVPGNAGCAGSSGTRKTLRPAAPQRMGDGDHRAACSNVRWRHASSRRSVADHA